MGISFRVAVAAAGLSLATPAWADKFWAVTPSGSTENLFAEKAQVVVGKLSSRCIDLKWSVVSSSASEVVCEAPLNTGQSIMGQLLLGNSYSTPPRRYYRFNVAEINGVSRVQASGWMELQMAFGQMKRQDFTGPEFHNGAMAFMGAAGGKLPVGTTFPNHAAMGAEVEQVTLGKYIALRLKKIVPGLPAEKAGLKVGDVVTAIGGKRFKGYDDYLDATAKAAAKPAYEVEISRDGKTTMITVDRAFRPTWTEQILASADTTVTAAVATPTSTTSVADELAKLAKLKSEGILTETEFEAQKRKLLGQ